MKRFFKRSTRLDIVIAFLFVTFVVSTLWLRYTGTDATPGWWALLLLIFALDGFANYRTRDEMNRQIAQKSAALAGVLVLLSATVLLLWLPTHEKAQTAASTDWLFLLVLLYGMSFMLTSLWLRYATGERPFWRRQE